MRSVLRNVVRVLIGALAGGVTYYEATEVGVPIAFSAVLALGVLVVVVGGRDLPDVWVLLVPLFLVVALVALGVGFWTAIGVTSAGVAALVLWLWRLGDPFPVAEDFELNVTPEEVRRGEEVELSVTCCGPPIAGRLVEVGIECGEAYPRTVGLPGFGGVDEIIGDQNHVELRRVALPSGSTSLRFRIPSDAPFTYQGVNLGFGWDAVAREVRSKGYCPERRMNITVLP